MAPLEAVLMQKGGGAVAGGAWERAWASLPAAKRDALIGLALDELAQRLDDAAARKAIRRPILDAVRKQVERMLKTPQAGGGAQRPGAEVLQRQASTLRDLAARLDRGRSQES